MPKLLHGIEIKESLDVKQKMIKDAQKARGVEFNAIDQQIKKSFYSSINEQFRELQRSLEELPPKTKKALLLLGDQGWYLDMEMPMPALWEFDKLLSEGDIDTVEVALIEYFKERVETIEKSIISKYPHRKQLIAAAFKAHYEAEYYLSIPVFLSQADGICQEITKESLFIKKKGVPRTAKYLENIAANSYRAALLSPLSHPLPIRASESLRADDFKGLNRHMILHGEDLEYGTEVNSLKGISLLNYISHVL